MLNFSVNTFDKAAIESAKRLGMGLEVEKYLWPFHQDEVDEKRKTVGACMKGFTRLSFHGTAISRDVKSISVMPDEQLMRLYNESYQHAAYHCIDRIVFHSQYLREMETVDNWIARSVEFWKAFLRNKPASCRVYLENFVDDTPKAMAKVCDSVGDERFAVCLDTGHAHCNSLVPLSDWILTLNRRIGHVHLHNNDGLSDRHWPLGRGNIDFNDVFRLLREHIDTTFLVLECDLAESVRWLRDNGYLLLSE